MKKVVCILLVVVAAHAAEMTYKTFRSPPITLKSGQIANTPGSFGPFEFPPGPIAVRHFSTELIDTEGNIIPLDEVYNHHWLMYNGFGNGGLCINLPNIWGIGAEATSYDYPEPFAVVLHGNETWTANLHFIRTTNVPDVQACIECRCEDSKVPDHPHGSVNCCPDQGFCWGMQNSTLNDPKTYHLQYTIGYVPVTDDVVPLTVFSLDATAKNTYDCHIEYDIPAMAPGTTHVLTSTSTIPSDWSVAYMAIHQHIGGLNFTVEHWRNGEKVADMCVAVPTYGTGSEPHNEKGYLTAIPPCTWSKGYQLKGGDELRFTSVYGPRTLPGGHPWHEGVMSLVFVAAHTTGEDPHAECVSELYRLCGWPPYPDYETCGSCAEDNRLPLTGAKCTRELVEKECRKTWADGNVPVPDSVDRMTLHIEKNDQGDTSRMVATGPADSWFAVAYNDKEPLMDGAFAFVYTVDENNNHVVVQRQLGNHFEGKVLDPNYPAKISIADGIATIAFEYHVPDAKNTFGFDKSCFLFAQGTSGKMQLEYHGAFRGFTCAEI